MSEGQGHQTGKDDIRLDNCLVPMDGKFGMLFPEDTLYSLGDVRATWQSDGRSGGYTQSGLFSGRLKPVRDRTRVALRGRKWIFTRPQKNME